MSNPKGINQYSGMSPANAKKAKQADKWAKEARDRMNGIIKPTKPKKSKQFRTAYGWAGGGKGY